MQLQRTERTESRIAQEVLDTPANGKGHGDRNGDGNGGGHGDRYPDGDAHVSKNGSTNSGTAHKQTNDTMEMDAERELEMEMPKDMDMETDMV